MEQTSNKNAQKVLIVDDIIENIQLLVNLFHNKGVEISIATSGAQALKTASYIKPDLILLDVAMPEMNGYEVCQKLKADELTNEIPIIFITAKTQHEDVLAGLQLGAVDYITKPFNMPELSTKIDTHLELKRSKDLIKLQNKQLIELNNSKDKFFSLLAHDLKNPFNAVLGFSEIVLHNFDQMKPERLLHIIKQIHKSAENGSNLLTNLLEWSRCQSGHINCFPSSLDLSEMFHEIVEFFSIMTANKNISINITDHSTQKIWADENMVNSILRNLINNAIKFSHQESHIDVNIEAEGEYIEISITDYGLGISDENQARLFNLNTDYTTVGTENEKGTGLGLIICKEFAEVNKGYIRVFSKLGKGSTFTLGLPALMK